MSESSANGTPIKSQPLSELESLFNDHDLDCVVILGAHILFPANATLEKLTAVRDFFAVMVKQKKEEQSHG